MVLWGFGPRMEQGREETTSHLKQGVEDTGAVAGRGELGHVGQVVTTGHCLTGHHADQCHDTRCSSISQPSGGPVTCCPHFQMKWSSIVQPSDNVVICCANVQMEWSSIVQPSDKVVICCANVQMEWSSVVQMFRWSGHLLFKCSDGVVICCPNVQMEWSSAVQTFSGHLLSSLLVINGQSACLMRLHTCTRLQKETETVVLRITHTTYFCVNRRVTYVTVRKHIHSTLCFI